LLAVGAVATATAIAADAAAHRALAGFGWSEAALLIAGCESFVAALIVSGRRISPAAGETGSLVWLLSGATADAVMTFAIGATAIVALLGNTKAAERLGYILALLVLVPLCAALAWRRRRAGFSDRRQRLGALPTLAATSGALVLARALAPLTDGEIGTSRFLLIELVAARGAIALAARLAPKGWLRRFPASAALAAVPLLLLLSAGACIPSGSLNLLDLVVPLALGLLAFYLVYTNKARRVPRGPTAAVDAIVVILAALVVFFVAPPTEILAENQNYFLGPALDVLHGHPMLVSTFSQYGVGMVDALAAVFLLVPIGYGTFTLLLATLTVGLFTVFYVILRWSTRSLLVAVLGLSTVVALDVFGQILFYAYFPSTGVLRFGLPWLVILCSLAAARTARHERLFDTLELALVAIAVVWSGEAGAYCLGTASVLACLRAALVEGSARRRLLDGARRVAVLFAVAAFSVLAFTLVLKLATGVWPDWGGYLEYIQLYTIGNFGALLIVPWSPGLLIGCLYTVSAVVIVLLVMTRPAFVRERVATFRAATGLTALGVLVYTYFLGRSHPNNVIHVSPPAIALVFVWFDLARSTLNSRAVAAAASAAVVFFAASVVVGEHENFDVKYPSTALGALLGTGPPLGARLQSLWHNPVSESATPRAVALIKSLRPPRDGLVVLMFPTVVTEVLLRLGIANAVTSSNPAQEALSQRGAARVSADVAALRPGAIVVIDGSETLLPIQRYAFEQLHVRFSLKQLTKDTDGLVAYRTEAAP
jgi:hypothetical protein